MHLKVIIHMKMNIWLIIISYIINIKAYKNQLFTVIRSGENDPYMQFQKTMDDFLFGPKENSDHYSKIDQTNKTNEEMYAHYASGNILRRYIFRGELFNNRSMVHLPFPELMHRGHIYLHVTTDYMQTAVDAFGIFLEGTIEDILRLPTDYVLRSSRTIAMMKITHEKLAATWTVVKNGMHPVNVPYETLEMYRPLFKYVNGREMARLNLSDERILNYIGTHPDLNRHQVGVVANSYIQQNPDWRESRYLNLMNNLICGVPVVKLKNINEHTLLQLAPQVLGKSYSWNAHDLARLGMLLIELDGSALSAVNPPAMAGLAAQVMEELPPHTLHYITEAQLKYIHPKALNILARKLQEYKHELLVVNKCPPLLEFDILMIFVVLKTI